MKSLWMSWATIVILALPPAASASSSELGYAGRLLDSSGTPLSGDYDMTFRLYTSEMGGTPVYAQMFSGVDQVAVDNGYFYVRLFGSTLPSVLASHASLFLEIEVGPSPGGDILSPRQPLTAAPWVIGAAPGGGSGDITAVTVDGKGLISGGGTSGDVTITAQACSGTGQYLEWNGSTWECATPGARTSCASGYVASSNGSDWVCADSPGVNIGPTPSTAPASTASVLRVRGQNSQDVTTTIGSGDGFLQLIANNGSSMLLDSNEIQAVTQAKSPTTLRLQPNGGSVQIGDVSNAAELLVYGELRVGSTRFDGGEGGYFLIGIAGNNVRTCTKVCSAHGMICGHGYTVSGSAKTCGASWADSEIGTCFCRY